MSTRSLKIAAMVKNSLMEVLPVYFTDWHIYSCVISDVSMTKDLSIAKVYVDVGDGDDKNILSNLNNMHKTFTYKITQMNKFRRAPKIIFMADESNAHLRKCEVIRKLLLEDEK